MQDSMAELADIIAVVKRLSAELESNITYFAAQVPYRIHSIKLSQFLLWYEDG